MSDVGSLDSIERERRNEVKRRARERSRPYLLPHSLACAVCLPLVVIQFIFVPFIGQALGIFGAVLTAHYLWVKRSPLLAVAMIGGGAFGISFLAVAGSILQKNGAPLYYALGGLSVFGALAYIVLVSAALWHHYREGEQ